MLEIKTYSSIDEFYDATMPYLSRHDIQNNLIIGNVMRVYKKGCPNDWVYFTINDHEQPVVICLMTPPFRLLLFEVDNQPQMDAMPLVVSHFETLEIKLPGVIGAKQTIERFLEYLKISEPLTVPKIVLNLRLYRLNEVEIPVSSALAFRQATNQDLYYLPYWYKEFVKDTGITGRYTDDIEEFKERLAPVIEQKRLYVLEDEHPVSMAFISRQTISGPVIGGVYTPKYYRGKGYASTCVANLCENMLNEGNDSCVLFTDLANPTSNKIYQQIGFKPICDFDEYDLIRV